MKHVKKNLIIRRIIKLTINVSIVFKVQRFGVKQELDGRKANLHLPFAYHIAETVYEL